MLRQKSNKIDFARMKERSISFHCKNKDYGSQYFFFCQHKKNGTSLVALLFTNTFCFCLMLARPSCPTGRQVERPQVGAAYAWKTFLSFS